MEIAEYQKIIGETAVYPEKVSNFGLAYTLLGLCDEVGELSEKIEQDASQEDINKERGDVFWYITALGNIIGVELDEILSPILDMSTMERARLALTLQKEVDSSKIFGIVKKYYRDGKELDIEYIKNFLTLSVIGICLADSKEEILKILENNYNKLIKRRETNTIHGDGDNREE